LPRVGGLLSNLRELLKELEQDFKKLYYFVSKNGKLTLEQFVNLALNEEAISFFQEAMIKVGLISWRPK
jgi:hypothetical protein